MSIESGRFVAGDSDSWQEAQPAMRWVLLQNRLSMEYQELLGVGLAGGGTVMIEAVMRPLPMPATPSPNLAIPIHTGRSNFRTLSPP